MYGRRALLSEAVLNELPGESKKQKFQNLSDTAPHWLLSFTNAIITAMALEIRWSVQFDAPEGGHIGRREGRKWPALPNGTLQSGERLPDGSRSEYPRDPYSTKQTQFVPSVPGPHPSAGPLIAT
jgi:hypothetical protein